MNMNYFHNRGEKNQGKLFLKAVPSIHNLAKTREESMK